MAPSLSVAIRNMYKHLSPTSFEAYWGLEMDEGSTRDYWFVDRKETIYQIREQPADLLMSFAWSSW